MNLCDIIYEGDCSRKRQQTCVTYCVGTKAKPCIPCRLVDGVSSVEPGGRLDSPGPVDVTWRLGLMGVRDVGALTVSVLLVATGSCRLDVAGRMIRCTA